MSVRVCVQPTQLVSVSCATPPPQVPCDAVPVPGDDGGTPGDDGGCDESDQRPTVGAADHTGPQPHTTAGHRTGDHRLGAEGVAVGTN